MENKVDKKVSFARRDRLLEMQQEVQKFWEENKTFQTQLDTNNPKKYFITFPYPYVNGKLHMGHAFSFSKADFAARFKKLMGYNVLLPQAFHCTGMPINAAADKLKYELETFGNPPQFPEDYKKSKQYATLIKMGIPQDEIIKFINPYYWLEYFPPRAQQDLTSWGAPVDWRRSFITTDKNPYYDSFVRWQFTLLKERGYIKFGKRPSIFCIKDNQMCADHDRSEGEGVGPQEYTLIKMKVQKFRKEELQKQFEGKNVFLVAATLRPETMFGQTNCFILPTGVYGAYEMKNDEIYVCSDRSALNMAYQYMTKEDKKVSKICDISGEDLLGLPIQAPLAIYPTVYTLPMMSIKMDKGTGVVTSVPSDSPDDWAAYRDIQNKDKFREKYGITEEMVNLKPVPIIDIPGYGNMAAQVVCDKLGIQSQNDREKLAKAKEETYTKGFYEGIMCGEAVGKYAGMKVQEAKNLVRDELLKANLGAVYFEPESKIISRSQDECIVALCDQWYIRYGEEQWRNSVYDHAKHTFHMYSNTSYQQILFTIDWLKDWGCSRSYGLGTRMPFDEQYLIESLSDSTIYMSYYTIAQYLQGDIEGNKPGLLGITPQQMTRECWDYIFQNTPYDATKMPVKEEDLQVMRKEFSYWYPLDLRVSAKDLVRNHLTMSLYNHAAIWEKQPQYWPQSYFTNGYVNINGEKMSKEKGNFFTIEEIINKYGADASRFACAEAGDTLEDANFTDKNSDEAVLKLSNLEQWIKNFKISSCRTDSKENNQLEFYDRAFENQMNMLYKESIKSYELMKFRDVTKNGFHEFSSIKDNYLLNCGTSMPKKDLMVRWIELQLLLLTPITPHFCEYSYKNYFLELLESEEQKKQYPISIYNHKFPEVSQIQLDFSIIKSIQSYNFFLHTLRKSKINQSQGKVKGGPVEKVIIVYAKEFLDWQKIVMDILQNNITTNDNNDQVIDEKWKSELKADPSAGGKNMGNSMAFGQFLANQFQELGEQVFNYKINVDQGPVFQNHKELMKKELDVPELQIVELSEISTLPPLIQKQIKDVRPFNPKDIWVNAPKK